MDIATLKRPNAPGYLDGQLLIAMPGMPDPRFARTLIYLCAHSDEGAMGLVINRPARTIAFPDLLVQLEIISPDQAIVLPGKVAGVAVLSGGPMETKRGFVLHSSDVMIAESTLEITEDMGLTISLDMLRRIARGEGPESAVLALGYASWGAGQLEREIQDNTWLHSAADPKLVFGHRQETKYDEALRALGIEPAFLSQEAGHA